MLFRQSRWLFRASLVVIAALGVSTFAATRVHAARAPLHAADASAAPNQTSPGAGTYTGKVVQNGPTLILKGKDGERQVSVAPGAPVLRDHKTTTIDKLKKGDTVTVTLNAQGVVERLDATSGGTSAGDVLKWLIPLIVLAIVVAAVAWWLATRRRSGPLHGAHLGRPHHV